MGNEYTFVDSNLRFEYTMKKDEILVEIELGLDSHKYGDDPVVLSVQAYWGDEGTRKFGGEATGINKKGNTVITKKVKLTNKRNRQFN